MAAGSVALVLSLPAAMSQECEYFLYGPPPEDLTVIRELIDIFLERCGCDLCRCIIKVDETVCSYVDGWQHPNADAGTGFRATNMWRGTVEAPMNADVPPLGATSIFVQDFDRNTEQM